MQIASMMPPQMQEQLLMNFMHSQLGDDSDEDSFGFVQESDSDFEGNLFPGYDKPADKEENGEVSADDLSFNRLYKSVLVDCRISEEQDALLNYFDEKIKFPFEGVWKRNDGKNLPVVVHKTNGWNCGVLLEVRLKDGEKPYDVPACEITTEQIKAAKILQDHRVYLKHAIMINSNHSNRMEDSWDILKFSGDSEFEELLGQSGQTPDSTVDKEIMQEYLGYWENKDAWKQLDQAFFNQVFALNDPYERLEKLLNKQPGKRDLQIIHRLITACLLPELGSSTFVWKAKFLPEEKKHLIKLISLHPDYRRRGIHFSAKYTDNPESKFLVPMEELVLLDEDNVSISAATKLLWNKAIADYKAWREAADIMTYSRYRSTFRCLIEKSLQLSTMPGYKLDEKPPEKKDNTQGGTPSTEPKQQKDNNTNIKKRKRDPKE